MPKFDKAIARKKKIWPISLTNVYAKIPNKILVN